MAVAAMVAAAAVPEEMPEACSCILLRTCYIMEYSISGQRLAALVVLAPLVLLAVTVAQ